MSLRDPAFAVIGGGTGLSIFLKGLKRFSDEITAIVTVADNGGGSGRLREEIGILPPGDIRNCLVALANTEPAMEALLLYRYKTGDLAGQNVGNLLIAALCDIYGDFGQAVEVMSSVLNITGRVLPVTTEDIQLKAWFEDGSSLVGEASIPAHACDHDLLISRMDLVPSRPPANPGCLQALDEADIIVLGPGSLYTSIIPNLLVKGIGEAIRGSQAEVYYVANIMTQRGETQGMSVLDHIRVLEDYGLEGVIDGVVVNETPISSDLAKTYWDRAQARQLLIGKEEEEVLSSEGISIVKGDFLDQSSGRVRHDGLLLSQRMLTIADRIR